MSKRDVYRNPLAIELFAGKFGWGEGLVAEGWRVVGFDILHESYHGDVPAGCELVIQDVCTLHGTQFKDADLIVASPPCQEFSYRAMPWKRAKALPPPLLGTNLFWQCWRIQQEACEAAGRYIPMVVENVKGAQKWIGRAKGRYGSFFLWGDIENVGGRLVRSGPVQFGMDNVAALRSQKHNPDGTAHGQGSWFKIADSKDRGLKLPGNNGPRMWSDREVQRLADAPTKNNGGSWFAQAHNTESGHGQNPDGRKGFTTGLGRGHDWRQDPSGRFNSKSSARKAASAQIAKIPAPLARHIARVFKPEHRG